MRKFLWGLFLIPLLALAGGENTIQLQPSPTGDLTIVDDMGGIVRVTADTAATINQGVFKTFPVDIKDYTAATAWAHWKSIRVGNDGDVMATKDTLLSDSLNVTLVIKTADFIGEAANAITLRTDSLTNGDTGSVNSWIGTCAGFTGAAPDSVRRYIWWEVTFCDSMLPDTNQEGYVPIFDLDFDFGINPKR